MIHEDYTDADLHSPVVAMHILTSAMSHILGRTEDEDWETLGYHAFELLRVARESIHREVYPGSYERNYGTVRGSESMNRISIDNPMLETLKDIDLRATQARLASQIGKQSKQHQIDFLLGELERMQEVARKAIADANGELQP